jgi:hypothetical protein
MREIDGATGKTGAGAEMPVWVTGRSSRTSLQGMIVAGSSGLVVQVGAFRPISGARSSV